MMPELTALCNDVIDRFFEGDFKESRRSSSHSVSFVALRDQLPFRNVLRSLSAFPSPPYFFLGCFSSAFNGLTGRGEYFKPFRH